MSLRKAINIFTGGAALPPPTSANATVQAWLNKIGTDGYAYPSQAKVDIYTTAWDYADAQGLTSQFDIVGLTKVDSFDLIKIPFINVIGPSARFTIENQSEIDLNVTKGIISNGTGDAEGRINTNFIPRTNATKSSLNNCSLGSFTYDVGTIGNVTSQYPFGASGGGNSTVRDILNAFGVRINTSSSNTLVLTGLTNNRLTSGVRSNSTQALTYLNGSLAATTTQNSSTIPNVPLLVLMLNTEIGLNNSYSSGYVAFFYHGSGAINQANLNTFVNLLLL